PLAAAYALAAAVTAYPLWLFFRKTDELAGAMGIRDNEASFATNAGANLRLATEWLWTYWTPTLALLALVGPALGLRRAATARTCALLGLFAVAPTVAFVAVSEIWYPRYLLFTTVPMLVLAAIGLVSLVDALARALRLGRRATALALAAALLLAL